MIKHRRPHHRGESLSNLVRILPVVATTCTVMGAGDKDNIGDDTGVTRKQDKSTDDNMEENNNNNNKDVDPPTFSP